MPALDLALGRLGHKARRRMCPLYVAGLIGRATARASSQWRRDGPGDYDQLHHFISSGVWNEALLEEELAIQADKLIGGASAVLVVDDTALPKKGAHSVGVASQYASALGKTANCQTLVSLTLAGDEVPVMIGLRLFLPESWAGAPDRMAKARVPENWRAARTSRRSRWPRSIASAPLAFGLRRCWRMRAMACPRRSAKGSTHAA
jgi:SRSO17 transposase